MSDRVTMRPCSFATKKGKYSRSFSFDDDIPDSVMVEILCRLPCWKSAVHLKCVSKRWCILISEPFFISRFLRLQSQRNKPIPRTLIFSHPNYINAGVSITSNEQYQLEFFSMSSNSNLDLDTNCSDFKCVKYTGPPVPPVLPWYDEPVMLLASYNDLVLCCLFQPMRQVSYYICNPRTKQCRELPQAPTAEWIERVGFVCNPYYKKDTTSDDFHLDFNYEFKVVRIYSKSPEESSARLINVEIFSSATGEWTDSTVTSPESFRFDRLALNSGIVHKGMLHWWGLDGFVFVLDLNNNDEDGKYSCHLIKEPQNRINSVFDFLGVDSRGRMRLCELESSILESGEIVTHLGIWELDKEEKISCSVFENNGRWTSIVMNLCVENMISKNPLISECLKSHTISKEVINVRAFDPEDPDILYLELCGHIVMCNIRTETLEKNHKTINMPPYRAKSHRYHRSVIPLALPWWPTPVEMETDISDDEAEDTYGSVIPPPLPWPAPIQMGTYTSDDEAEDTDISDDEEEDY